MSELEELQRRVTELEADRKSFFKTGIMVLGAATIGLSLYIWKFHIVSG
jgi:hypothetical protein